MTTEDDFREEGARPSSLIPVHKLATRDPLHDMQLLRDVAIINERVRRELGPMPKDKKESDRMRLEKLAAVAAIASVGIIPPSGAAVRKDDAATIPEPIRRLVGGDMALLAHKSVPDGQGGRTTAIVTRKPKDPDPGPFAGDRVSYSCELVLIHEDGQGKVNVTGRTSKAVNCEENDFNRRADEFGLNDRLELAPHKVTYRNDYHRVGSYSYSFSYSERGWQLSMATNVYTVYEEGHDGVSVVEEKVEYPLTLDFVSMEDFDPEDISGALTKSRSLIE